MGTEAELTQRIEEIKAALADLGDMRPGSLSEQYNTCGAATCRCKSDPAQRHGPYHQLSYSRNGRSTTENVAAEDVGLVRAQIANYHKMRSLVDEWVEASTELGRARRTTRRPKRSSTGS